MSLRTFHLFFILVAIVAADMFGAWTIYYYYPRSRTISSWPWAWSPSSAASR